MRPLHLARAASHRAAAASRTPAAAAASPPDLAALRTAVRRGAGPLYDRVLADDGPDTGRLFDDKAMADLSSALGHPFRRAWLLRAALLHRSFDAETYRTRSSELLAWIGDSVMYQSATSHLLARFPDAPFGDLAKARIALISRAACDQAARRLGIHTLLRTGASFASAESAKDGVTASMTAEAFEGVLGAVACDAGHEAAAAAYWRCVGGLPDRIGGLIEGAAG